MISDLVIVIIALLIGLIGGWELCVWYEDLDEEEIFP